MVLGIGREGRQTKRVRRKADDFSKNGRSTTVVVMYSLNQALTNWPMGQVNAKRRKKHSGEIK